jgi:hypothetical protein
VCGSDAHGHTDPRTAMKLTQLSCPQVSYTWSDSARRQLCNRQTGCTLPSVPRAFAGRHQVGGRRVTAFPPGLYSSLRLTCRSARGSQTECTSLLRRCPLRCLHMAAIEHHRPRTCSRVAATSTSMRSAASQLQHWCCSTAGARVYQHT